MGSLLPATTGTLTRQDIKGIQGEARRPEVIQVPVWAPDIPPGLWTPPERGKTPGNSTVSTTLGSSAEDLVTASMAVTPAGSYRPQGLCLAQLCCHPAQLTPVTDREHRREGLQPTPAGSCSILSLRAQSVRGLSGPWQICRRGAGWAGLLISHSVALILASLQ